MRIIGIDPGIDRMGYALIDFENNMFKVVSYGLIHTDSSLKNSERLMRIYDDLSEIINKYTPQGLSVETLIFAKNSKTAMVISEVRGVVLLKARQSELEIVELTPLQIKKSVSGYGKASKYQVREAVRLILGLKNIPSPDDVSDALAIAIAGSYELSSGKIFV